MGSEDVRGRQIADMPTRHGNTFQVAFAVFAGDGTPRVCRIPCFVDQLDHLPRSAGKRCTARADVPAKGKGQGVCRQFTSRRPRGILRHPARIPSPWSLREPSRARPRGLAISPLPRVPLVNAPPVPFGIVLATQCADAPPAMRGWPVCRAGALRLPGTSGGRAGHTVRNRCACGPVQRGPVQRSRRARGFGHAAANRDAAMYEAKTRTAECVHASSE